MISRLIRVLQLRMKGKGTIRLSKGKGRKRRVKELLATPLTSSCILELALFNRSDCANVGLVLHHSLLL